MTGFFIRAIQPAFAGSPQNGGVLGAAPLGEGEAEKPKALERGGDFPPCVIKINFTGLDIFLLQIIVIKHRLVLWQVMLRN
jgi:hypothetical protein